MNRMTREEFFAIPSAAERMAVPVGRRPFAGMEPWEIRGYYETTDEERDAQHQRTQRIREGRGDRG